MQANALSEVPLMPRKEPGQILFKFSNFARWRHIYLLGLALSAVF